MTELTIMDIAKTLVEAMTAEQQAAFWRDAGGDDASAYAVTLRMERDAAVARAEKAEKERDAQKAARSMLARDLKSLAAGEPVETALAGAVWHLIDTLHGSRKVVETYADERRQLVRERDVAIARAEKAELERNEAMDDVTDSIQRAELRGAEVARRGPQTVSKTANGLRILLNEARVTIAKLEGGLRDRTDELSKALTTVAAWRPVVAAAVRVADKHVTDDPVRDRAGYIRYSLSDALQSMGIAVRALPLDQRQDIADAIKDGTL